RLFAARLRLRTFALLTDCVAMARRYSGAARPCNSCRHNRHRGAGILAPGAGCAPATPFRETILSETMQRLSRTSQVIAMLARYRRAGILTGLDLGDVHEEDPAQAGDDELAERFVSDLEAMGPAFVKLGQALSTRPDLVPAAWIAALERTQDNATPAPIGDIEVLLEKELGVRASKLFAQIDAQPMAAASLAQVHRAVLHDGRVVALKIQRPDVAGAVRTDLDVLARLAGTADSLTDAGRRLRLADWIAEFRKAILDELDYRTEAENLE